MKKICCLILCFFLLAGCVRKPQQSHETFCRVLCLTGDGFIAETEQWDKIYFKCSGDISNIRTLDTVVVTFSEKDLMETEGAFVDCFGAEDTYSYILEEIKDIRFTVEGEPTFG